MRPLLLLLLSPIVWVVAEPAAKLSLGAATSSGGRCPPPARPAAAQVNVKKWHKHFLWHEEGGFSFEVALESLRRKLHNLQVQRAPWPPPPPPRAREPWPL